MRLCVLCICSKADLSASSLLKRKESEEYSRRKLTKEAEAAQVRRVAPLPRAGPSRNAVPVVPERYVIVGTFLANRISKLIWCFRSQASPEPCTRTTRSLPPSSYSASDDTSPLSPTRILEKCERHDRKSNA